MHVEKIKVFWKKFKGNTLVTMETKALLPYVERKKRDKVRLDEHLLFSASLAETDLSCRVDEALKEIMMRYLHKTPNAFLMTWGQP